MGLLLYYVSGVLGVLRVITSLGYFEWNRAAVLFAVFLCCIGIWAMGLAGKRYALLTMAVMVLCCAVPVFYHTLLQEQLALAWLVFREPPGTFSQIDLTPVLILAMALLSVFLYWLSLIARKGWLFYPVTALLVAAAPYLGGQPDLTAIWLLAFFHLGDRVTTTGAFPARHKAASFRRRMMGPGGGQPVLLMLPFAVLCLALAFCLTAGRKEIFFQFPLDMEQDIRRSMQVGQQLRSAAPFGDEGRVSRGNRQFVGKDMVALRLSKNPEETIYLKQFTGNRYENDRWTPAAETAFVELLAGETAEQTDSLSTQLNFLPFDRLWKRRGRADGELGIRLLDSGQTEPIPYLAAPLREEDGERWYRWYLRQTALEAEDSGDEASEKLEQAYRTYVYETYTQVEPERFPGLASFCDAHPVDSVEEAIRQVTQTLEVEAEYTLTPGVFPPGREIPEYFLFEGKKGYCVHFASTAVLLYRLYGIPARYASGYIAPASAFSPMADGSHTAVLPDTLAHAWPEIYMDGVGWIPVEATPARAFTQALTGAHGMGDEDENGNENGNGANAGQVPETAAETDRQEEMETPENSAQTEEDAGTENRQPQNGAGEPEDNPEAGGQDSHKAPAAGEGQPGPNAGSGQSPFHNNSAVLPPAVLYGLRTAAVLSALALIGYGVKKKMEARRSRILKQQETYDVLRLFERFCQVVKAGGYRFDPGAGPSVCAGQLEEIPGFTRRRAAAVMAAVDQAAFGNRKPTPEENRLMWEAYGDTCQLVLEKLTPVRRWYFCYIKVYW